IGGWETRARYCCERLERSRSQTRWQNHKPISPARLTEVRMVEEIKGIRAELQVDGLGYLGVLNQCQIEVRESGTIENVAPQIAETVCGWNGERRHGIGDPLGGVPADLYRGDQIRANGVASARSVGGGENNVEGIAALHDYDRCQFPPADEAIALKRQIVDSIRDKPVPGVEIGISAAVEDVRAVLHDDSRVVTGNLVDGV